MSETKSRGRPLSTDAELVYAAYPRRVGRAAASREIDRVAAQIQRDLGLDRVGAFTLLTARARGFARLCERNGTEPRFIPHPATWFRRGSWDDEDVREAAQRQVAAKADPTAPMAWSVELAGKNGTLGSVHRVLARDGYDRARVLAEFTGKANRIDEFPTIGNAVTIHPAPTAQEEIKQ